MSPTNALFLHSEVADPYTVYAHRRAKDPLQWDDHDQIWAAYGYEACTQLLNHPALIIPSSAPGALSGLSPMAVALRGNLARLSNPPHHDRTRQAALGLFCVMQPVDISQLIVLLLQPLAQTGSLDWVAAVGKKLPVLALLAGFRFAEQDTAAVLDRIDALTRLMLPQRTEAQCLAINEAVDVLYPLLEKYIKDTPAIRNLLETATNQPDFMTLLIGNLMGLLIQSYDAGRGLLTNALVQTLAYEPKKSSNRTDDEHLKRVITETLRFDPAIHNTRRMAAQDVLIDGIRLQAGQSVLIVLAAANRDGNQFVHPDQFDPNRVTNSDLLTFGAGIHACVARHTLVDQTARALGCLFRLYPGVRQCRQSTVFEPLVNARLLKKMYINIS